MHIGTESLVLEFSGELDPVIVKPIDEEGTYLPHHAAALEILSTSF